MDKIQFYFWTTIFLIVWTLLSPLSLVILWRIDSLYVLVYYVFAFPMIVFYVYSITSWLRKEYDRKEQIRKADWREKEVDESKGNC